MTGRVNNLIKKNLTTLKLSFAVSAVVLTTMLIVSCPALFTPMDDTLLAEVVDTVAPIITIISPDQNTKNYYGREVVIEGIVKDYSDEAGKVEGGIESLVYADLNYNQIGGDVVLEEDGSFTISFESYTIEGDFKIQLDAVDWNGNESFLILDFFTDVTGPLIALDHYGEDSYNYYSSSLDHFTIAGTVSLPAIYVKLSIESDGTELFTPVRVDPDDLGVFSIDVNPSE